MKDTIVLGRFEPEKTRQAAGVVFRTLNRGVLGRMKLLKLLYIADRESVRETGFSITGDNPVAMEWGPVLSATYNCMKGESIAASVWQDSFTTSGGTQIKLIKEPGTEKLSPAEVETLVSVANGYGHLTGSQLSDLTHGFEEWLRNKPVKGSSRPIPARDRLEAVGLGHCADELLADAEEYALADRLLDSPSSR